jgi:hypothetical protein
MTSTDDHGYVKYWQANLNNVHTFQAHNDPVRSSRWDKLSSAVLLLIVVINNSCNVADKLFQFRKNDKVTYVYDLGAVLKCTHSCQGIISVGKILTRQYIISGTFIIINIFICLLRIME